MSDVSLEGGCQCGSVRYRIVGSPLVAAICHCSMCRRANAAPVVAWAMYKLEQVTFLKELPTPYQASPEATRGFCGRCGTQISFVADYIPGLVDITIASLDNPEAVAPSFHYWYSRHLEWMRFGDVLPKHPEFPPNAE
jgi:hypothetical protein